eukprot:235144-Amphidinium_carterae.1
MRTVVANAVKIAGTSKQIISSCAGSSRPQRIESWNTLREFGIQKSLLRVLPAEVQTKRFKPREGKN